MLQVFDIIYAAVYPEEELERYKAKMTGRK
jgi:hypothetical protein